MRPGLVIYACLLTSLFYFSEGKPCPQKTRPHKTRCDAYYQCRQLPSNSYVWVPKKCSEGLVYEQNIGLCVLPGEDWECVTPSELMSSTKSPSTPSPDTNILIVNDMVPHLLSAEDDGNVEIVLDGALSSEEQEEEEEQIKQVAEQTEDTSSSQQQFDSSGDGELVDLDGLLPAQNRQDEAEMSKHTTESISAVDKLKDELNRVKDVSTNSKMGAPIDPNLTAHLQRLSQLIDGLQQTYQHTDKPEMGLRPDQLNAFLAHFKIKNGYDQIDPTTTTTMRPTNLPKPTANKTQLQEHLNKNRLQPETKLMLSNSLPYGHTGTGPGYANSQIVVNRPEGAVMFALPPPYNMNPESQHSSQSHESYQEHNAPKISEETLKTVLELSKQMIAAQNVPKIIPNPGYNGAYYAQPMLQPFIYSPHGNPFQQYYAPSPVSYDKMYVQHKKHGTNSHNKPSTTIIHNNVIPVHVSSTSSGEKEVLDTYGHSLGRYPSMTTARPGMAVTTMSHQYDEQYGQEFTLTTPRPFEQPPSAATLATFYTPSPHLNDHNANHVFQATESYPNRQFDMFPSQLEAGQVKIRPNSQKIESMEAMDTETADDVIKANFMNENQTPHVLTYSSGSHADMSQQLAPSPMYLEQHLHQQQHQYLPRPTMSSSIYADSSGNMELSLFSSQPPANLIKYPGNPSSNGQLVNFNGHFLSLDVFQKSILPLLTKSPGAMSELGKVEVITCQPGVRQPNQTDCTRYFVCSKKDGKVLSYSCPPYTGFNTQTRICDAQTYAQCGTIPAFNGYSIDENKRLQMETLKMLSEAKRRQEAALKAQNIAHLLQQYGSPSPSSPSMPMVMGINSNIEQNALESYMANLPPTITTTSTTTMRPTPPPFISTSSDAASSSSSKKRKYYCKEGDKIPDQTSISSYFVCYKNAQGQMKGHKMTCSKNLLFCPKTLLCTFASKCTG